MDHKEVLLGGHVSSAGGLWKAIENAEQIGARTIQIFGSSPRQWKVREHSNEDVQKFKAAWEKSQVESVFLHAPYLANIASPSRGLLQKSEEMLVGHLRIAEAIGSKGLIFHIGSSEGTSKEKAFGTVTKTMKRILNRVPGRSLLIVENSAGGGQSLGSSLEEIAHIAHELHSERVAVCFDTAHAFEAGIVEKYTPETVDQLAKKIRETITLARLVAIHANDSKTTFNSHHDRHENIGEGHIGLEGFRALINHQDFRQPAWLLEVPGFDGKGPDKKNVEILKNLIK